MSLHLLRDGRDLHLDKEMALPIPAQPNCFSVFCNIREVENALDGGHGDQVLFASNKKRKEAKKIVPNLNKE
jgi:hypothetical protein